MHKVKEHRLLPQAEHSKGKPH